MGVVVVFHALLCMLTLCSNYLTEQSSTIWYSTVQHSMVRYGTVQYRTRQFWGQSSISTLGSHAKGCVQTHTHLQAALSVGAALFLIPALFERHLLPFLLDNSLGNKTAAAFGDLLESSHTLKELDLSWNQIKVCSYVLCVCVCVCVCGVGWGGGGGVDARRPWSVFSRVEWELMPSSTNSGSKDV